MMIATRGVCVVWTPRRRDRRLRRPIDAENESARRRSPSKRTTRGNADTAPTEIYLKLLVVQRLEVRAGRLLDEPESFSALMRSQSKRNRATNGLMQGWSDMAPYSWSSSTAARVVP